MSLEYILTTFGYLGIFGIIFAESGLMIGFFLPGDSLLFAAGVAASKGIFNIWLLLILSFIAAVTGDSVGYTFGHTVGRKLFNKKDSMLFKKEYLEKAEHFYIDHGKKTIILARFIPVVRTFAPIVAGIAKMHYKTFLVYNLIGGFLWAVGLTAFGFFLGSLFHDIEKYLEVFIIGVILLSLSPALIHFIYEKIKARRSL